MTTLVFGNAFDHVLAMERVLEGGEPVNVWPCVSLSRVVTEGCARICYMRDPNVTSEERLTRSAAAWLDSCREHRTAAREFYPERTLEEAEAAWKKAEQRVTAAGMTIGADKKKKPISVTYGEAKANLSTSLVDILRPRQAHVPSWYRISSGASHNTSWLVQQGAAVTDDGVASLRADPNIITAATLAVLGAFEDVTQTFGVYHGHQDTDAAVRTVQMRTAATVDLQKKWQHRMEKDASELLG
jgi:hypothetical protein